MEELLNVVGNVGFPIAVAVYLLIRIEGKLAELTSAINELREAVITLPSVERWNPNCLLSPPLPGNNVNPRDKAPPS